MNTLYRSAVSFIVVLGLSMSLAAEASAKMLIVRGANNSGGLNAKGVAGGSEAKVTKDQNMVNLSVNCGDTEAGVTEQTLLNSLPQDNRHALVTTLTALAEEAQRNFSLDRAPRNGNDYHCLLSGVTAQEFVGVAEQRRIFPRQ